MRAYQTKQNKGGLPDSITVGTWGAGEINSRSAELGNAVSSSGQTLATSDGAGEVLDQLAKAMSIYGAGGAEHYLDTGAANSYVLSIVSPKKSPESYFDGFCVVFKPGNINTGASTVNIAGIGSKNVTTVLGAALVGGELAGIVVIKYNLSSDRFELVGKIANDIFYDNTISALNSGDVQAAIDETSSRVDGASIISVGASIAASALTVTLDPVALGFRSTTLGTGTTTSVATASALSLVVPSGATLGTVNTVQSSIAIVAINNAGTMELACINLVGGVNLDETDLISTVAIDTTADLDDVFYSATALTNVAYRVVGFVESTQAVAGTWDTAPSLVQGVGGQAMSALSSLGYAQKWQSSTKVKDTTYYNETGKPIAISVRFVASASTRERFTLTIGGVLTAIETANETTDSRTIYGLVPPNAAYILGTNLGTPVVTDWLELR